MAKKPAKKKEKEIISKTALVDKVAKQLDGMTKKDVAAVVNTLLSTVVDAVRQGDEVRLIGFGTFKT
ncbi:MAG: HU family DNA-binding protein, partial [Selenomonadaceae bacterium]|nr:HU family DNA-binding protein [Selenomonadaceae bacterium]